MENKLEEREKLISGKKLKIFISRFFRLIVAILVGIVITVIGGLILVKISNPPSDIITQEFERDRIVPGGEVVTDRIRAGDTKTLRLKKGIVASYKIRIPKKQDYDLIVRYSNDDTGEGDNVLISFKNDFISFHSLDTKEEGEPAGSGWSNFVETEPLHLDLLEEGNVYISFVIIDEDGYGIELDRFTLQPIEK